MVIFRSDSRLAGAAYGDRQGTSSQDELTIISGWIAAGDGGGAVLFGMGAAEGIFRPGIDH